MTAWDSTADSETAYMVSLPTGFFYLKSCCTALRRFIVAKQARTSFCFGLCPNSDICTDAIRVLQDSTANLYLTKRIDWKYAGRSDLTMYGSNRVAACSCSSNTVARLHGLTSSRCQQRGLLYDAQNLTVTTEIGHMTDALSLLERIPFRTAHGCGFWQELAGTILNVTGQRCSNLGLSMTIWESSAWSSDSGR